VKGLTSKPKTLTIRLASFFIVTVLGFAFLYYVTGHFESHAVMNVTRKASLLETFYFSVVSITTLGYGDFVPHGFSCVWAAFEAVFGIVFIGYSIT